MSLSNIAEITIIFNSIILEVQAGHLRNQRVLLTDSEIIAIRRVKNPLVGEVRLWLRKKLVW